MPAKGHEKATKHMTAPTRRNKRKGCGLALALAFGLPALVWVLATWYTGAQYQAELKRLRRAGEPLDIADLVRQVPPGEQNAADLYLQAFALKRNTGGLANVSGIPSTHWTETDWAAARTFVTANQHYFDLLGRATRLAQCAFPFDPNDPSPAIRAGSQMREAARALMTRAELQMADGQADAALWSCAAILRLGEGARSSPVLVGVLTSSSLQGTGLDEMQRVLSEATPSPVACRAVAPLLDDGKWRQAWVRAMQGERANAIALFRTFEGGTLNSDVLGSAASAEAWRYNLYLTLGRPLWNGEKLANLELATARIEMMRLPWSQAIGKADQISAEEALLPAWQTEFTRPSPNPKSGMESTTKRLPWIRDKGSARLRAAQIALALETYKAEHASYPASLSDLEKGNRKLPTDPFTGQAYRYRQVGKGFIVYSVGPDLRDDGGTDFGYGHFKPSQPGYDFVFRCAR